MLAFYRVSATPARVAAGVALAVLLVAGCASPARTNGLPSELPRFPSDLPRSPSDLPPVEADLELSGAIQAHVTQVRAQDCGTYRAGSLEYFEASLLFEWHGIWHSLEVTTGDRISVDRVESGRGFVGPGSYTADIYLRELVLGPGGMITGDRIWFTGYGRGSLVIVSPEPRTIGLRGIEPNPSDPTRRRVTFVPNSELWPTPPGFNGPFVSPAPTADEVVVISGSWKCA